MHSVGLEEAATLRRFDPDRLAMDFLDSNSSGMVVKYDGSKKFYMIASEIMGKIRDEEIKEKD